MITPHRVQLSRVKGFRLPADTVVVARPSRWGNPWKVGDPVEIRAMGTMLGSCAGWYNAHDERGYDTAIGTAQRITPKLAVELYDDDLRSTLAHADEDPHWQDVADALAELAGRNLACWCPLDQPCHADVLLELANR